LSDAINQAPRNQRQNCVDNFAIHSHSIVSVIKLIILNLSTGIYARFELIFDWTIDYKSVALPIEL